MDSWWLAFWWIIPLAFYLDISYGDPALPWKHPVTHIGKLLLKIEPIARKFSASRITGLICMLIVVFLSSYLVFILTDMPIIGYVFAVYFSYAGLALGSLLKTSEETIDIIERGTLEEAQKSLAMLVSRDTSIQERETLRKSMADTLSENLTDAIIAPFFWLCLGGPVALWFYKAVSTMDSMWGYKTDKWIKLGWACAKLDDLLAFIPARLSVLFLYLAGNYGKIARANSGKWPGYNVIAAQAKMMESPNSGWSMATAAWIVGARMGGPTLYFGRMVNKPWVGPHADKASVWDEQKLRNLCALIRAAAIIGCFCMYVATICLAYLMIVNFKVIF